MLCLQVKTTFSSNNSIQRIIKGNMRDYASVEQLLVLSNLENINAVFIEQGIDQYERLRKLNKIAITQLKTLTETTSVKQLKALDKKPKLKG